jgi:signal recognition particle subunit SEC65
VSARIDLRRIRQLAEAAEKLGFKVIHIHADIKTPGQPPRIKLDMVDKKR